MAGIREAGATAPLRVARLFHGAWLDAFVYAEAAFTVIDPELLRLLPARILVDERGFAKTLIERVDALDQRGRRCCPKAKTRWCAFGTRRCWCASPAAIWSQSTLFQVLENYLKLRELWYRGPRAGLLWLARCEPEMHTGFARALEPRASLEDLRALVQRILPAQ